MLERHACEELLVEQVAGDAKDGHCTKHDARKEPPGTQPFCVVVGRRDGNHTVDSGKHQKVVDYHQGGSGRHSVLVLRLLRGRRGRRLLLTRIRTLAEQIISQKKLTNNRQYKASDM